MSLTYLLIQNGTDFSEHSFLNDLDRIVVPKYMPTAQDVLNCRLKTMGIIGKRLDARAVLVYTLLTKRSRAYFHFHSGKRTRDRMEDIRCWWSTKSGE